MIEKGTTVKVISLELTPYINTSNLFEVVNDKPYGKYDGWIEIANDRESIITREKLVEVVEQSED